MMGNFDLKNWILNELIGLQRSNNKMVKTKRLDGDKVEIRYCFGAEQKVVVTVEETK